MVQILHKTRISKTGSEGTDFDTNYKSEANEVTDVQNAMISHDTDYTDFKAQIDGTYIKWEDVAYIVDDDYYRLFVITGKQEVVSSSLHQGTMTCFAARGDKTTTPQEIGGGEWFKWDFSNTDNDVTAPSGYKRKQIDVQFIDNIWIKEGVIYYHNKLKGSYVRFSIVCPSGQYYYKEDGTLTQATEDVEVYNYVIDHPIQGTVAMGDEMNTEIASINPMPPNYVMRCVVTVPDTDSTSNGNALIELYRARTAILD